MGRLARLHRFTDGTPVIGAVARYAESRVFRIDVTEFPIAAQRRFSKASAFEPVWGQWQPSNTESRTSLGQVSLVALESSLEICSFARLTSASSRPGISP